MDPKSDMIREDIDETRSALTQKLETLEGQLRETVVSAKQTVEGTIENVKDSVRRLSPTYQTREHPWIMFSGAIATGVVAGRLIKGRSGPPPWENASSPPARTRGPGAPRREEHGFIPRTSEYEDVGSEHAHGMPRSQIRRGTGEGIFDRFSRTFDDEIQMMKGMILTGIVSAAGEWLKHSVPHWGSQIDQVLGSAVHKMTSDERPGRQRAFDRSNRDTGSIY